MEWKIFFLEILKASIWPAFLLTLLLLFKKQLRELLEKISKFQVGNTSVEFGKKILAKEVSERRQATEYTPSLTREDIFNIPDEDYEFMIKISENSKFMPVEKSDKFRYNSLVNNGYFIIDNGEYKPTDKGAEIIAALKSIYH
ncbi:hypothetical protein P8S54_00495 [Thiomicrospira sp. R3]|uniref:hypothetical protein n=1 Tax=Thiomicrospira sp. R3 TaxID=3035472 RepID=UPI00259BE61F|nr:hypothetical protein [Thiomicrospira sp. R3]WFE68810.1 hypothetical protein P8S54_00495 [Thiomicrospira sp. R3]